MTAPPEDWRPVAGFDYYEVSSHGRVRSLAHTLTESSGIARSVAGRVLKPGRSTTGYLIVALSQGGVRRTRKVHQLVADAFHGPRPSDMHIRHADGERHNNAAANLSYGTRAENEADKVAHGTSNRGSRHGQSKLVELEVQAIDAELRRGIYRTVLAARYGVGVRAISDIATGATWSWLTGRNAA